MADEHGGDESGAIQCGDWSAWYNRQPGANDDRLHVAGKCRLPSGTHLMLEPVDIGVAPDPGLFALQASTSRGYGVGHADDEVSWEGDAGPDINRVRIQGAVSAEIEVTEAQ